jgi:hypothetical protein
VFPYSRASARKGSLVNAPGPPPLPEGKADPLLLALLLQQALLLHAALHAIAPEGAATAAAATLVHELHTTRDRQISDMLREANL